VSLGCSDFDVPDLNLAPLFKNFLVNTVHSLGVLLDELHLFDVHFLQQVVQLDTSEQLLDFKVEVFVFFFDLKVLIRVLVVLNVQVA